MEQNSSPSTSIILDLVFQNATPGFWKRNALFTDGMRGFAGFLCKTLLTYHTHSINLSESWWTAGLGVQMVSGKDMETQYQHRCQVLCLEGMISPVNARLCKINELSLLQKHIRLPHENQCQQHHVTARRVKVKLGHTNQSIFYIKDAEYKLLFHWALVRLQLKFYVHFSAPLFQINMH